MIAHPAKYSDPLYPHFQRQVDKFGLSLVLDCMAGVGGIHKLGGCRTVGVELEHEWACQHPSNIVGDATRLPFRDDTFDGIIVSPAYGNRMADKHEAKDGSNRFTYRHKLGRQLTENNGGGMQWGQAYRELHEAAWVEAARVLRPDGVFMLNCKNHYRNGRLVDVVQWHVDVLARTLNVQPTERIQVPCPGMGFGANRDKRVPFEDIVVFTRRPAQGAV